MFHLIMISPKEIDQDLYSQLNLLTSDPRAHLIPFMEDPTIGYGAMNCLLLPSYGEGLGM